MHYGAPQNNPPRRNHHSSPSIAPRTLLIVTLAFRNELSAISNRQFARLETTFNSLKTKADTCFLIDSLSGVRCARPCTTAGRGFNPAGYPIFQFPFSNFPFPPLRF